MSTIKSLHFKWTISKGRDTYGYNICSLTVDGEKVARCIGGGYDMQGTCLGEWLQTAYQTELVKLMNENGVNEQHPVNTYDTGDRTRRAYQLRDFYGMTMYVSKSATEVYLDGGCGFSSMERIAKAIGIKLQWNKESDKYKNHTFYTAIIG